MAIQPPDVGVKYAAALRCECDVILDTLEPPPGGVAAVVARVSTPVQQVGQEAVSDTAGKG